MTQGVIDWNKDGYVLSAEQKKEYAENGFIVIKNVVPKYDLERYTQRFKVY